MNVSGPRGLQAQDHCKYARIADHFTPVVGVAYRCYAGGLRSHRLPRLWISSIGSVPGRFSPSNAAFGEYLSTLFSAAADRIEAPTQHWSIAVWNAFRSEREHSGELQIILLFVGTARELTKDEYFVGCRRWHTLRPPGPPGRGSRPGPNGDWSPPLPRQRCGRGSLRPDSPMRPIRS